MTKSELIEAICEKNDLSKKAGGEIVDALFNTLQETIMAEGKFAYPGFGTFTAPKRAARTGRNPRTGATIKIKAAKVPKFRPGKGLKDALNGSK